MDVRSRGPEAKRPSGTRRGPLALVSRPGERKLTFERIGQVLGEWQPHELRIARGFAECRGLSAEQLEDIYQETAVSLLRRPYLNEEHLRNSLREGLKYRALNLHRDERRRGEILAQNAPGLHRSAEAREGQKTPELAALAAQDRSIITEFLTELTEIEQRVFWLIAEGMRYRAIAPLLGIPTPEAQKASRSCERKRERFQLLYDTGRLCGYRAGTILALQDGQATSEELAERAFAHLDSCRRCRDEHKTNAKRLRRSFQGQAAALLPPVFIGHLRWLARLGVRARTLQHRLMPDAVPAGGGGVRERAAALLAGGGVGAKVAAGAAIVAVIAGGTIGATHALDHPRPQHRHRASPSATATPRVTATPADLLQAPLAPLTGVSAHRAVHISTRQHRSSPGHVLSSAHRVIVHGGSAPREPSGFAYLGVPTGTSAPASAPEQAHTAARSSGGLFSP
jgi:RNA polymerase sigma factor (sigma-70 family)